VLCLCFELKLLNVTLDALDLDESKNSMSFNLDRAHNAESATNLHDEIAAYMILSYAATSHSSVADHDVAFNDQNRSSSSMFRISDRSTVFADEDQLSRQNLLEMHNLENQRTEYSAVHNSVFADEDQLFRQNPLEMHNLENQRTEYSVHDANFENEGQITISTDQSTSYSTLYDSDYMSQDQGQTTNSTNQSISYFALYDSDYVNQGQGSNDTPQLWEIDVWENEWLV